MAKICILKDFMVQVENVGPEQSRNENSKFVPGLFHFGSQYVPPMSLFPFCSGYKLGQTWNTTLIPRLFLMTIRQEWERNGIHQPVKFI